MLVGLGVVMVTMTRELELSFKLLFNCEILDNSYIGVLTYGMAVSLKSVHTTLCKHGSSL